MTSRTYYETGIETPEILGSGSTYSNVVYFPVGWINGETSRDALQWLSEVCDLCDAFNWDGDE